MINDQNKTEVNSLRKRYPENYPIPPDKLNENKLYLILEQELKEWTIVKSPLPENPSKIRVELYREYFFKDFDQVLEYMTSVAKICNTLPHHPRWENTWTTLKVYLTTWDSEHIISYKDIMLARHMETIYNNFGQVYFNLETDRRIDKENKRFFSHIDKLNHEGKLEEAFSKLSQYISQPNNIDKRKDIEDLIIDFNDFTNNIRNSNLTKIEIEDKTTHFKSRLNILIETFRHFKPKIFFSYAWGNDKEKIVDELYDTLKKEIKYDLVRDKVDLGYKGLISDFMKGIGKGNFVIIALSDKYLRSEYCMFELYELYRNSNMESKELLKKIYPIRVENLDLNNPKILREYFSYWKNLELEWKNLVTDFDADQKKYRMIQSIRYAMTDLLSFLNDINSMTTEMLSKNEFAEIKNSIEKRLVENN